jgi:serine/threonine-protein kinase
MSLQPGEIIEGKYRIVRLVGEGGMGAVYEGENTRIKRKVAIKVLHSAVAEKTEVVQRFEREAQAAGRIGSEHIVEVLDLGNLPSSERYMVMEFLEGEDLTTRIKRRRRLAPEECVPILVQVLEGLGAAHEAGIVHRDLKPDNIFILASRAGRPDFVKLLDFGVSKFTSIETEMSMTRTGAVMGTPYYMSPEQAKGGRVDQRSDLYAIGVVAYQMLTGRVPFTAGSFNELLFKIVLEAPEPVAQIAPEVHPGFVAIVGRAMEREPDQRFQSAREFQQALIQWQAAHAPHAGFGMSGVDLPAAGVPSRLLGPAPGYAGAPHAPTAATGAELAHTPGAGVPALGTRTPMGIGGPDSFPAMAHAKTSPSLGAPPVLAPTPPGGIPVATPPTTNTPLGATHTPSLALSHAVPPQRGRGMAVALVAVSVGIVCAGGLGAFLLTRSPAADGPPAAVDPPPPEPTPAPTPTPTAETPPPTAEPEDEPAAPSATAVAGTAAPVGKLPPPGSARAPASAAASAAKAPAGSAAPTSTAGGRKIKIEL